MSRHFFELFRRVPPAACPPVLTLISLSRGRFRLGTVHSADGECLRAGLAAVGQDQSDAATIKKPSPDVRNSKTAAGSP